MSGASEQVNGRASGPVLRSVFLAVIDHSAMEESCFFDGTRHEFGGCEYAMHVSMQCIPLQSGIQFLLILALCLVMLR